VIMLKLLLRLRRSSRDLSNIYVAKERGIRSQYVILGPGCGCLTFDSTKKNIDVANCLVLDLGLVASQGSFILMKLDFVVENMYSSNAFAIPSSYQCYTVCLGKTYLLVLALAGLSA